MLKHVNIGCGRTPTKGWVNFDNSEAIKLSKSPVKYALAKRLRLLNAHQIDNINWLKSNEIGFADATKRIPIEDNSAAAIYTSHMVEHLSRAGVKSFLTEVRRVLAKDGVLRVAIPDLDIHIKEYLEHSDADKFMKDILVEAPATATFKDKLKVITIGYRHHQWMYNGASLVKLLERNGFSDVTVKKPGETMIENPGELNLFERESETVVVEARVK